MIRPRRTAFTLIELLVVIGIIAVLAALVTAAALGVRSSQMRSNSEAALTKVDGKLLKKMREMDDSITNDLKNNRAEAPTILAACGDNKDVAKAVMKYARMRRDFPMSVAEANTGFTVCGYQYKPNPAFNGLGSGPGGPEESAACLYAALAGDGLEGLEQQTGTNSAGQKVFIDTYDSPLAFIRLGYDGDQGELNKPTQAFDPFYPAKQGAAYRNLATDFPGGATAFNSQVWQSVQPPSWAGVPNYPPLKNHTAFVFSAGSNRDYYDSPVGMYAGDNLFSFRLRKEGAKGD